MSKRIYIDGYTDSERIHIDELFVSINGVRVSLNNSDIHGFSIDPSLIIQLIGKFTKEQRRELIKVLFQDEHDTIFYKKVEGIING
jgi:hypothetical protein